MFQRSRRRANALAAPNRRPRHHRSLALVVAAAAVVVATGCRTDSNSFAPVFNAVSMKVVFEGVDTAGAGHVGLDIAMGDPAHPYNPCHQHSDANGTFNDPLYSACQDSRLGTVSYFKHHGFTVGGREVAGGKIAWTNFEPNVCGGKPWCPPQPAQMFTDFARKSTYWAIEFYPYRNDEGGVRIQGLFEGGAELVELSER